MRRVQRLHFIIALLAVMLTATTAWAQAPLNLTLEPNYEGAESGIVIPVDYEYINGGYHYSLNNFNPANYPQFIRDGLSIIGWASSSTGSIEYAPDATVTLTKNLTLYATWGCTYGGMKYKVTSDSPKTVELTGYDGDKPTGALVIPASVTIGGNSYAVTSIGDNAFYGCTSLTWVTIPASVTSIGNQAFYGCTGLASVIIPASVTSIGHGVFNGCSHLASINVDDNNAKYASEDGVLFNKEKTTLVRYPICKSGTSYDIPASVTSIGGYAFRDCTSLTSVTIPASVTSIGNEAFVFCISLASVIIPANVTSIGNHVFYGCSSLTSVTVYAMAVPTLGTNVFYDNADGRKIYVFKDTESAYETAIYWNTYASDIEPITLGVNDAGEKGKWCSYCNDLADVTVPAGTTVYKAKMNDAKTTVTLTETGSQVVKRGEAVLLKSTADIELSSAVSSGTGDYSDNELLGGATVTAGYDAYTLAAVGGVMGFYRFTGAALNPNRAHLEIPVTSSRDFLGLDDETTSLNEELRMKNEEFATAGEWYTLDGRRLSGEPAAKGLYIHNGRKEVRR